jgi:DNA-directed RNA polymerase specialized sigma24 family protein
MFKGESAFGSWIDRLAAAAAYQKLRTRRRKAEENALDDVLPALEATAATSSRWTTGSGKVDEPGGAG